MMKKRLIFVIFLFLFLPVNGFAGFKLYLLPEVKKNKTIYLADIVRFDRLSEEAEQAANILIKEKITCDGFIDKNEVSTILKEAGWDSFLIYGHSVRILNNRKKSSFKEDIIFSVKAGDEVVLSIRKKTIIVRLNAIALADGVQGDLIPVKLKKGRKLMARVKGRGKVINSL